MVPHILSYAQYWSMMLEASSTIRFNLYANGIIAVNSGSMEGWDIQSSAIISGARFPAETSMDT
jgi:hypothetical protein